MRTGEKIRKFCNNRSKPVLEAEKSRLKIVENQIRKDYIEKVS